MNEEHLALVYNALLSRLAGEELFYSDRSQHTKCVFSLHIFTISLRIPCECSRCLGRQTTGTADDADSSSARDE